MRNSFKTFLQKITKEISDFTMTLADVKDKGHLVVIMSSDTEQMGRIVDGQVSNLEESYSALGATLSQILVRKGRTYRKKSKK